jgi:hypothetical protein
MAANGDLARAEHAKARKEAETLLAELQAALPIDLIKRTADARRIADVKRDPGFEDMSIGRVRCRWTADVHRGPNQIVILEID